MDLRILAADGFPLAATLVGDAANARSLVTINPATAVPRRFYAQFAEFLAGRGHLVLTYDWRGMGESVPAPGARMRDWGERDLTGILAWAQKEYPSLPLAGFGHSAGGQMLALAEGSDRYRAFVGIAAQTGHWRYWPGILKWRRAFDWWVLFPTTLAVVGRIPPGLGLGDGLPKGIAAEWSRWCRHRDYIFSDDTAARRARAARLSFPFLSYSFTDDSFGPKAGADWLAAQYANTKVERRHVRPSDVGAGSIGHMGFFRRKQGGPLWEPTAEWLEARL